MVPQFLRVPTFRVWNSGPHKATKANTHTEYFCFSIYKIRKDKPGRSLVLG